MFILGTSQKNREKLPFLSPDPEYVKKMRFFRIFSRSTQDKHIKLYIFEISIKFRVDWCIMRDILKNFIFFDFIEVVDFWGVWWGVKWPPNGLNFFPGVFMIFVHKIKNENKKINKSEKMEHSRMALMFVTKEYEKKVNGKGPKVWVRVWNLFIVLRMNIIYHLVP